MFVILHPLKMVSKDVITRSKSFASDG